MKGYNLKDDTSKDQIKAIYNKDFERCYIPWANRRKNPDNRFQWAIERLSGKTLLDYGCGDGIFLAIAKDKKFRCTGYDISNEALEMAKLHLKNKAVLHNDESLAKTKGKFDNVTCFEVLEHLDNPLEATQELFDRCKVGGRVVITVPIEKNFNDPMHRTYFSWYDLFNLISRFTYDFHIYQLNKHSDVGSNLNLFGVVAIKVPKGNYDKDKTLLENIIDNDVSDIFKIKVTS